MGPRPTERDLRDACRAVAPRSRACRLGAAGKAAVRCLKDHCVAACTHHLPGTAPLLGVRARLLSMASARASCSYREVTGSRAWSPTRRPSEGPVASAPPRLRDARSATRFGTCGTGRVRERSAGQGRPLVPRATAVSCRLRGLSQTQGRSTGSSLSF